MYGPSLEGSPIDSSDAYSDFGLPEISGVNIPDPPWASGRHGVPKKPGRVMRELLRVVDEGIFDGLLVSGGQRAKAIHSMQSIDRRLVEAGRAARSFNSDVGGSAIVIDIE